MENIELVEKIAEVAPKNLIARAGKGCRLDVLDEDNGEILISIASGDVLSTFGLVSFIAGAFDLSLRPGIEKGAPYRVSNLWELRPRYTAPADPACRFLSRQDRRIIKDALYSMGYGKLIPIQSQFEQCGMESFKRGLAEIAPVFALQYRIQYDPRFDLTDAAPEELNLIIPALENRKAAQTRYLETNRGELPKKIANAFKRDLGRKAKLLGRCRELAAKLQTAAS